MKSIQNKILFVSHDAYRAGAAIVLKHHLEYFKKQESFDFDIALLQEGILMNEFSKLGKVFKPKKLKHSLVTALLKKAKILSEDSYPKIPLQDYRVIYGNTVVSCEYLKYIKQKDAAKLTVCHVHEMDYSIKYYAGKERFLECVPFIDMFIAASLPVKQNLMENYGVPENKIKIHYEYIPVTKAFSNNVLTDGVLKICGCGTTDWRKGIDVFIRTAYQLKKATDIRKFHFYWLGAQKESIEYEKAMFDIEKLGIKAHITLIQSTPDPFKIISRCNLFYLTSREDPFPLVCLEAASLGLPIVCFEQSGGMTEFISDQNGWVLPYLDIDEFVQLAIRLAKKPEVLSKKGLQASQDVRNYDINVGGKLLEGILNEFIVHQANHHSTFRKGRQMFQTA